MPLRDHFIIGHDSGLQPFRAGLKRVSSGAVCFQKPDTLSLCADDLIPAGDQSVRIPSSFRIDVHSLNLLTEHRYIFTVRHDQPGDVGLSEPGRVEFLRVVV